MRRLAISILATLIAIALLAAPARAAVLYFATFVSSSGNDSNDCSTPATACLTFNGALVKTENNGQINCVEGYVQANAANITIPVTIDCGAPGTAILSTGGTAAFTININKTTFPKAVVNLRNLVINGLAKANPVDGILVQGGGAAVHIENSKIFNFGGDGLDFEPSSSLDLFIRDSIFSNNAANGIFVVATGPTSVRASLNHVRIDRNGTRGLYAVKGGSGAVNVTLSNSEVTRNPAIGVEVGGATIRLSNSVVTLNGTGLKASGGQIVSFGNNSIHGNAVNGVPTSTVPLK